MNNISNLSKKAISSLRSALRTEEQDKQHHFSKGSYYYNNKNPAIHNKYIRHFKLAYKQPKNGGKTKKRRNKRKNRKSAQKRSYMK
jgi:hypothetical protein